MTSVLLERVDDIERRFRGLERELGEVRSAARPRGLSRSGGADSPGRADGSADAELDTQSPIGTSRMGAATVASEARASADG
jgi:hypothetical protein